MTEAPDLTALPAPLAGKLGLLIPRLGSAYDGEVIATARAIVRVLEAQRRDLHDLAMAIVIAPARPVLSGPPTWRNIVEFCFANVDRLRGKEAEFVRNMGRWSGKPTEKQRAWLEAIYSKLEAAR